MNKNERLDHAPVEGGFAGKTDEQLNLEFISAMDLAEIVSKGPRHHDATLVNMVLNRATLLGMFPKHMSYEDVLKRFYR